MYIPIVSGLIKLDERKLYKDHNGHIHILFLIMVLILTAPIIEFAWIDHYPVLIVLE